MTDIKSKTFQLSVKENKVAYLKMDVPGESMNTLKAEFADEISEILAELKSNSDIVGVVLHSGKDGSFVAGADINMLASCSTAEEATALSRQGQRVFDQIAALPVPVVAAIDGACLGGGLELAMACHSRICTDSGKTALGLPEVQLGLLPGSGGTQRLPKLVGIQKALDMMLTGKQLRAKQALKAGLVDDVVPSSVLLDVAEKTILSGKIKAGKNHYKPVKLNLVGKVLEKTPFGRKVMFDQASKTVAKKTQGNYPAPQKIIDCVKMGVEQAPAMGYQLEADHFGQLVMTPESFQLRQIFFATTEMKKEQGIEGVEPEKISKVAVLGGGLMGGGIAFVTATKAKLAVRIKDIGHLGLQNAFKYSFDLLNKKIKRRFMRKSEMQKQMAMITGATDYVGFNDTDLVIEAVFEDLSLKQNMVKDIERECQSSTIFASNTSSLPIGQIAEGAQRPENVIGLHYFSPVDKMPLAEIIPHEGTSDATISTTVALAKKQGKTPIVVKDKAGFYVNRILAPYMNEAAIILLNGGKIDELDRALVKFGFPVGPMQLLDEVGIDVGSKIGPILQKELGERFAPPAAFSQLIDDGRLGKKAKKGFYRYDTKKKEVDDSVYKLLSIDASKSLDKDSAVKRSVFMMLNEAARCLDEGIVRSARDGDIGAIFGIGFPPFLGGPFRYMDSLGIDKVVQQLNQFKSEFGDRFEPCEKLVTMATEGKTFY